MSYPDDAVYSREHEWVRADGDLATVGITSFAADELGDIVYVELPEVGSTLAQFATFGVVESVKAVSDLYAPVSGTVVEVNDALRDSRNCSTPTRSARAGSFASNCRTRASSTRS